MSELMSVVEFSEDIASAEQPVPLPPGEYTGEVRSVEVVESQKGNRYFKVAVFFAPEQYPADYVDGDPDGTTLIYNRVPAEDTKAARFRVRKFCEAIGAAMSKRIDGNEWIGLAVRCDIDNSEFEGAKRAEIKRVLGS
jgi:hypothetical protein